MARYKIAGSSTIFRTLALAKSAAQKTANAENLSVGVFSQKVNGSYYRELTIKPKRTKNPTVSVSSLPIGTWQPAHAIRQNADGTVDILREKNSGRRANISEGFMAGGVFHPIRHSADYDASRVGEKRKKKKPTKRAMVTSRREYGGDGSRYRNPGEGTYITSTPLAKLVQSLGYSLSKNATDHLGKKRSYRVVGGGRFGATTNYFNSADAVKKWATRVAKDRQLFS